MLCIWVRVREAAPLISLASVTPQAVWAALDKSISGAVPPSRVCVRVPGLVVCDLCLTRVSQSPYGAVTLLGPSTSA